MPTRFTRPFLAPLAAAALSPFTLFTVPPTLAQDQPPPAPLREHWSILHCGTLLAVPGQPALKNMSVVVKNNRIAEVLPGAPDPANLPGAEKADVQVIDLSDKFVLPGLIDCHTHLTMEFTRDVRLRQVEESDADNAIKGVVFAKRTLEAGFTTVRDVGSVADAAFAVRDAINAGLVPGPRMLVSGHAITPTGGHADNTLGYRDDLYAMPGPMQGAADGADACRQAVRAQVKRGADVIKLTATGGVLSNTAAGTEQQFFDDELASIVQAAHLLNRKVAAHAHGVRGINAALRAGVDSIEHGTFLDDESLALFKQTHAFLVPTIIAGKTVEERAGIPGYYTRSVAEKARTVGPVIQAAFTKAYKAGVRIAFGTDAGVYPHGENAREFGYMVEGGMSPMEAITAATVSAAELLSLSKEIGTIEPGKAADIVATASSPLDDVKQLRTIVFVMRDGVVYKHAQQGQPHDRR